MKIVYQSAFTLVELLVTMAILAILMSIAVPAYFDHVETGRRSDAQAALLDLYARMERYYAENNTYATATVNTAIATDVITDAGSATGSAASPEGFYTLTISAKAATSFTLTATPTTAQSGDTFCANLTINSLSQKGQSGSGTVNECWR